MVRNGVWCDVACVVIVVILTYLIVVPFFGITIGELPSWVSTHMIVK